ncbi:MAG: hypothetical protein DWP95_01220 [Proteobacteria bacterium]|nr:MAG: hypothetical protein DWP95_01220 [Pseudomonadota bacterium]
MGPQNQGDPGTHIQFYIELANILSTDNGSGAPGDDPQIKPILIWAQGATKTNSKQGAFSTLIREYTHEQGVMHYKERFTDFDIPGQVSEMQEASNEIARRAFTQMKDDLNWRVQSIEEIANQDAVGVGDVLFDFILNDTINSGLNNNGGNNAAWSGVPFFSSFDDRNGVYPADETWRLIGADQNAVLDNLDDLRNVLYSHHAFNYGVVKSIETGGRMLIDEESWGELKVDVRTYLEVAMYSGRYDNTFATTMRDQVAEQAAQPSVLYGVTDTVNLIKSAK